jgi:shikimate dehydrogenase
MKFGLIGKSLLHSFSPAYFNEKFVVHGLTDYSYQAFELPEINQPVLNNLIVQEKLNGFNVTIPYKEAVVTFLDEMSNDAKAIGAVNTIEVRWLNNLSYTLKGYNTDWTGFLKAIRPFLTVHHQQALIIGTGGASKAIAYALKSLGIDYFFVSRNKTEGQSNFLNYTELNQNAINHFKLIINTTPLGTFPEIDACPAIPYQYIGKEHLICDLVYNPSKTKMMELASMGGASVLNGLSMLQFQADEAWEIWNNKKGHSV